MGAAMLAVSATEVTAATFSEIQARNRRAIGSICDDCVMGKGDSGQRQRRSSKSLGEAWQAEDTSSDGMEYDPAQAPDH